MAHKALDVIDEPALAIDGNDRNVFARNVPAVFKHLAA